MESKKKIFEISDNKLISYDLEANLSEIQSLKETYINNKPENQILYEIISNSKIKSDFSDTHVPLSTINYVKLNGESIIRPLNHISKLKKILLNLYVYNQLSESNFLSVYDDKTKKILYYFVLISEQVNKYKTSFHTNVLSLSKELFLIEMLLQQRYDIPCIYYNEIDLIKKYFSLIETDSITLDRLDNLLDQNNYDLLMKKATETTKLVHKIKY